MTDVDRASLTPGESDEVPADVSEAPSGPRHLGAKTGMAALTLGALGVVVGDIGTSLSRIAIVATDAPGMSRWCNRLFIAIARNAANPVAYFGLPDQRTVVLSAYIEL